MCINHQYPSINNLHIIDKKLKQIGTARKTSFERRIFNGKKSSNIVTNNGLH